MKAVKFEQANIMLAEDQPEYETLPIWADVDENRHAIKNIDGSIRDPQGEVISCFELTDEEVNDIVKNRRIWHRQITFWNAPMPISIETQNPFTPQENLVDNYKASQGQ
ncbi:MAG: hypothetical protein JWR05_3490 [Mucilaginibacter sp.]|nr:hypothetical protein [Mucilaginibacter sp.]